MVFRVVIAVDASEHASRAFDFYFDHLHRDHNEVIVVHAPEQPKLPSVSVHQPLNFPADEWQDALKKRQEEANKVESDYINRLVQNKVAYKVHLLYSGKPGEAICQIATEEKVNYIVMGARGLGGLRRTILGSVSDYVVHHAGIPVTVCPPPQHHHQHHH